MIFEIAPKEVRVEDSTLKYGLVPWDSDIFGFNVIEILNINARNVGDTKKLIACLEDDAKSLDARMICAKIPLETRDTFYLFQDNGYVFIEETIKPHISNFNDVKVDYDKFVKYPLRKANDDRIEEIQNIAVKTFRHDRFHLDKNFDDKKASERYSIWVRNSFNAGEDVLYLDADGKATGFSIVSLKESGYLGLIGLDPQYKGRGLGINLLAATCQYVRSRGITEFSTTTSFNNIQALNMYVSCGFMFRDPVYVLHKWI